MFIPFITQPTRGPFFAAHFNFKKNAPKIYQGTVDVVVVVVVVDVTVLVVVVVVNSATNVGAKDVTIGMREGLYTPKKQL